MQRGGEGVHAVGKAGEAKNWNTARDQGVCSISKGKYSKGKRRQWEHREGRRGGREVAGKRERNTIRDCRGLE